MSPDAPSAPELDALTLSSFHSLLEERTGLLLDARREDVLAEAVADVAARWDLATPADVLDACRRQEPAVFESLVSRITVGETYFFRIRPHFRALAEVVFPDLLERPAKPLRIWSAGCSTGEEAYSLAMTLDATARAAGIDLSQRRVDIWATDIDAASLDHARRAEYGKYSFRGVTDEEVAEYFETVGDERWRPKRRYRDMVQFRHLNLKTAVLPDPVTLHDVDLILCRNVTIYFSEATTRALADKFFETLARGGYLLVGHAEHSLETYRRFQARALPDTVLYQRGGDRSVPAQPRDLRELLAHGAMPHRTSDHPPSAGDAGKALVTRLRTADIAVTERANVPPPLDAARAALAAGDLNRAVTLAVEVLEANPGEAEACLLLGQLAADRGHVAEARIWLRRTLELRPLDLTAHYVLALLALERNERAEALACLERVLYVDPDFVLAHYLRARLLRDGGQQEAAARSLAIARAILEAGRDEDEVPFSKGITVAQLRAALAAVAP